LPDPHPRLRDVSQSQDATWIGTAPGLEDVKMPAVDQVDQVDKDPEFGRRMQLTVLGA